MVTLASPRLGALAASVASGLPGGASHTVFEDIFLQNISDFQDRDDLGGVVTRNLSEEAAFYQEALLIADHGTIIKDRIQLDEMRYQAAKLANLWKELKNKETTQRSAAERSLVAHSLDFASASGRGIAGWFAGGDEEQRGGGDQGSMSDRASDRTATTTSAAAREEKLTLDRQIEYFEAKLHYKDRTVRKAEERFREILRTSRARGDITRDDKGKALCVSLKRTICRLAHKLNPEAAVCAEALGRLYLRTPKFFLDHQLLGNHSAEHKQSEHLTLEHEPLTFVRDPEMVELLKELGFRSFQALDKLTENACLQDCDAIVELLYVLGSEYAKTQVVSHLSRLVTDSERMEARDDAMLTDKNIEGSCCAMTARWPFRHDKDNHRLSAHGGNITQNTEDTIFGYEGDAKCHKHAYTELRDEFERMGPRRGYAARSSRRTSTQLSLQGYGRMGSSLDTNHSLGTPSETMEAFQPEDPTGIEAFLGQVELNLMAAQKKDPLVHLTPLVMKVLLTVSARSMSALRECYINLYQHEMEVWKPRSHWLLRRQAATDICEQALNGNELACNLLLRRVLKDDHWMIRQTAVNEACRVLGRLPADGLLTDEIVFIIVHMIFAVPDVANVTLEKRAEHQRLSDQRKHRQPGGTYLPDPLTAACAARAVPRGPGAEDADFQARLPDGRLPVEHHQVREAAEKAMLREISNYSVAIRDMVFSASKTVAEAHHELCAPILRRMHEAVGSTKSHDNAGRKFVRGAFDLAHPLETPASTRQASHSTTYSMKKMRELQGSMDLYMRPSRE